MSAPAPTCALPSTHESTAEPNIYGTAFWLAYAANVLLVGANSLTFRFADFVQLLGGTERLSGQIVSTGLIAAILGRFWLGNAIDKYGVRAIWVYSSLLYLAGTASFLFCHEITQNLGQVIWLGRIAYAVGLAGMFSCSMVHIQNEAPPHRRTEMIGSLGSSGFIGTIFGTQIGDLIFRLNREDLRFTLLFATVAVFAIGHLVVVRRMTRNKRHITPPRAPHAALLLWRYWPGLVLLVAIAMGSGFVVTTVFLTRYATSLHLKGIGTFFLAYSITAFSCRWLFRSFSRTAGRHWMVLLGLGGGTIGCWLFLLVQSEWQFLLPAVASGFGHALLFPAVVSLGAGRFPPQYRGSGTTLVLGFIEFGTAIASPLFGALIVRGGSTGNPLTGFYWMFWAAGGVALTAAIIYVVFGLRHPDVDPHFEITELDATGRECADAEDE